MSAWKKIEKEHTTKPSVFTDYDYCSIYSDGKQMGLPTKYFPENTGSVNIYIDKKGRAFAIEPCKGKKGVFKLSLNSPVRYQITCQVIVNELGIKIGRYRITKDGDKIVVKIKDKIE